MSALEFVTPEKKITSLKKRVLDGQIGFLCEELGDPGRYFPYLRSKGVLNPSDCQSIRSRTNYREQVQHLIEILKGRVSTKGEQAFDILVDALKRQRVQAHIARTLQKALARAKEESFTPNGVETRTVDLPEEEVADDLPLSYTTPTTSDYNDSEPYYKMHPQHGALPPPPTNSSQFASDSDEHIESVHPVHGLLPPRSSYLRQDSERRSASCSGSESELGGQSQPNSMPTDSSQADSLYSSQCISHDTSYISGVSQQHESSVEVMKLESKIKYLTVKLDEASAEIKKKDLQIEALQQLLDRAGMLEQYKATNTYSLQPVRPNKLKMNGSDSHLVASTHNFHGRTFHSPGNMAPQPLHKEPRGQSQGFGDRSPNPLCNNLISRSKSSSPSSVSFV